MERKSLCEITGVVDDAKAISNHGYARYRHNYDPQLLDRILKAAIRLEPRATQRFLSLKHLRSSQRHIPEVDRLIRDRDRLDFLSAIAGCELEPYPIPTAAAHINYYRRGEPTIDFHTDGAALVELVPLQITGTPPRTSTLIYNGPAEVGRQEQARDPAAFARKVSELRQDLGTSILLQGRRILHSADIHNNTERITLVLVLRSKHEPWKDDNTLFRLLQDDEPEDVCYHWVKDVTHRQYPAFRAAQAAGPRGS